MVKSCKRVRITEKSPVPHSLFAQDTGYRDHSRVSAVLPQLSGQAVACAHGQFSTRYGVQGFFRNRSTFLPLGVVVSAFT